MSELTEALAKLDKVKPVAGGYLARCPCHDDKINSLSITEGKDGKLLLYCHAGCSFTDIVKALDIHRIQTPVEPQVTHIYDYTDEAGKLLYQVLRYHPKSFKQRRPNVNGGWLWNLNGVELTLYRLPEVIKAIFEKKMVIICEGEKDVDNLRACGQVATSISGGASSKWSPSLVPLFQNANVVIIPDRDEPGRKYAQYVANLLYGWCKSLKVVEVPFDKDVSEHLERSGTLSDLFSKIDSSPEYIPTGAVTRDEFNGWRGVNQYLWSLLLKRKKYKASGSPF